MNSSGLRPDAFEPRSTRQGVRRLAVVVAIGALAAGAVGGTFVVANRYLGIDFWPFLAIVVFFGTLSAAAVWIVWTMEAERDQPGAVTLRDFAPELAASAAASVVAWLWPSAPGWARLLATGTLAYLALSVAKRLLARTARSARRSFVGSPDRE